MSAPLSITGNHHTDSDRQRSVASASLTRLLHTRGLVAGGFLLLLCAVALAAPLLPALEPNRIDLTKVLAPPEAGYWLGYDNVGRDVLARLVFASRISMLAAVEAVAVALAIGVPLGLVSGYWGGRLDGLISRIFDAIMAVPTLLLAVLVIALLRPGLTSAMIAIGVVSAPSVFRLVRASTLDIRHAAFIEAAVSFGASSARILWRHVLPNIRGPLLVQIALTMSHAIIVEAALSFIGLGVQLPQASWGSMLRQSFSVLGSASWFFVLSPAITIIAVAYSFNHLGRCMQESIGGRQRAVA